MRQSDSGPLASSQARSADPISSKSNSSQSTSGQKTSRRAFLFDSSAVVLGALAAKSPRLFAQQAADEELWRSVRAQFAFSDAIVPMNAANLCPSFEAVAKRVAALSSDIDRDCSPNNRAKFTAMLEGARDGVARQL